MSANWSDEVAREVTRVVGPQPEITPAGGMSGASTVRLRGRDTSAILKRSGNPREWFVYTRLAGTFARNDIFIPGLHAHAEAEGEWWLLIEDVPHAIPQERWPAHSEAIAMLRRLHNLPVTLLDDLPDPYRPTWTPEMNQQALSLFGQSHRDALIGMLDDIRLNAQHLFSRTAIISGDPNPANWGMRDDGTPVLFDWERCTVASPAIDLGIIVPGLGNRAAFQSVSEAYAGYDGMASDIAVAKLWSVIEFLAGYAADEIMPAFDIGALINRVPAWIANEINP